MFDGTTGAEDLTVPALLLRNAEEFGDLPAFTRLEKDGTSAGTTTWAEARQQVAGLARGLSDLGLRSGDRMLIMATNRPEHWLADLAAVHLGAVPGTAYATLSPEQLGRLGRHSQARILVLEGAEQLARWQPVLDDLPALRAVVMMDEAARPTGDQRFVAFDELARAGAARHRDDPGVVEDAWRELRSDQPVTLLYTSGTTGEPKGVMISHRNVLFQAAVVQMQIPLPPHSSTVAYLPMAHIAERMLSMYHSIFRAGHVNFCPDATDLIPALRAVRPASFFGVPRVWEKMVAGLQGFLAVAPAVQRQAFQSASALAVQAYRLRAEGSPVPGELAAQVAEADRTVLAPIRGTLGLDNVVSATSGAAPIPVEVLLFLAGLGLDVLEIYGMTESTGTVTINTATEFRTGTVGKANPDTEVRLAEDGEILVRSPSVALGYLQADGSVEPFTDADGWLATGDVGLIDHDGYLTITDRKKELIITSGGKNVAPAQIENLLRSHPLIGQAAAIGDRRPYVTALIALDEEMAPLWARARGLAGDVPLADQPAVRAAIAAAVEAANRRLARAEQIKKFHVLREPWTAESGELTPTLKLRRPVILERHAQVIEDLYA